MNNTPSYSKTLPKILILGPGRSGTTSLSRGISSVLNLRYINEPWNYREDTDTQIKYPDDIGTYGLIKCLINQVPFQFREHKNGFEFNPNRIVDFNLDLQKHFDYIILLSRRDRLEVAKSTAYQRKFGTPATWHQEYVIPDENALDIKMEVTNAFCDIAERVSEVTGIPITWYEDLYSGDKKLIKKVIDIWGFNVDLESLYPYIDPKNRYRKTDPNIIINKVI